jgi:hypothetical protein
MVRHTLPTSFLYIYRGGHSNGYEDEQDRESGG